MEKLNFITKKKNCSSADVSLTIVGKKEIATSIIFRNDVWKNISDTGYLSVAILGDKLFFREEDESTGYKISDSQSRKTRMVSIKDDTLNEFALTHSGDYKLLYNKEHKLFYIDTE